MDVIREGLITKRLENLETKISEAICLELTVSNKKWFILFAYRPPQENNKYVFSVLIRIKIEITIYMISFTLSHYQI